MTTVASRPMRYGKSTLVDGAFLASCEAGESSLYENPKYTCFSRKALEAFKTKVREEERKKVLAEVRELVAYSSFDMTPDGRPVKRTCSVEEAMTELEKDLEVKAKLSQESEGE